MQKILNDIRQFLFLFLFFFPVILYSLNLPDNSIYHIDINMIDRYGKKIKLADLAGKIHIFSMIYTNCKTICPIIISNMKILEQLIPKQYLNNISFLLISLDPERDTIYSLNKFFLEKKLNNDYWNIYKVSTTDVLKIALATGIKYKKDKDNEYIHSNLIIILDKTGVIQLYHQGLDKNFDAVIKIISQLS
ncbi:MAG TPA: SCO family protein [Candidatus Azoamicus sp. OHIO2]